MTPLPQRLDPRLSSPLARLGLQAFEAHRDAVYGIWADLTLAYTNPGWERFAAANEGEDVLAGWGIGRRVRDAFSPDLAPFYEIAYGRCLATGEPWEHEYDCSGGTVSRRFHMRVLPVDGVALVVVHTLVAERPHAPGVPAPATFAPWRGPGGLILQCANCRNTKRQDGSERWEWVPDVVTKRPAGTSHGLCPVCAAYHYPDE